MSAPHSRPAPALVLDTNIVLDWLVFDDPRSRHVAAAILGKRVRWLVTAAMRQEFEDVLARAQFAAWQPRIDQILKSWSQWSLRCTEPPCLVSPRMRCEDADDQVFIDLALHAGASALISRDRAVLKLAPVALAFGLHISLAQDWVCPDVP